MLLSENTYFLRHNLFQKWKFLHLKIKYACLTFSGSNAGLYPRATVALETVDQGIKLKLIELFFLKQAQRRAATESSHKAKFLFRFEITFRDEGYVR